MRSRKYRTFLIQEVPSIEYDHQPTQVSTQVHRTHQPTQVCQHRCTGATSQHRCQHKCTGPTSQHRCQHRCTGPNLVPHAPNPLNTQASEGAHGSTTYSSQSGCTWFPYTLSPYTQHALIQACTITCVHCHRMSCSCPTLPSHACLSSRSTQMCGDASC